MIDVLNKTNAEHYKWGNGSEGWHLLKSRELSVIEERVPAGDCEERHYHNEAQQFFYILSGSANVEIAGTVMALCEGDSIHVPAKTPHQLMNKSPDDLRFLVVSQPKSHGDRVVVE